MPVQADSSELAASADALSWYHSIDLAPGVTTRGQVDCRDIVSKTVIPERLDGLRALDIGTWDGFWAFELERRGAEVITVDVPDAEALDWPPRAKVGDAVPGWRKRLAQFQPGVGFDLAAEALGSSVQRRGISIYDLADADLGTFDLVFVGSLLVHLRDPIKALATLKPLVKGRVVINDAIDLLPSLYSPRTPRARFAGDTDIILWWHPNLAGLTEMVRRAGFDVVDRSSVFFIPWGHGYASPSARQWLNAMRSAQGRELAVTWARGIPHCSLLCEPMP